MSGDARFLDNDGYLFNLDWTKGMIATRGENVYSAETENALSLHPDVAKRVAISIPDNKWGQRVHAIVRQAAGAQGIPAYLIAHCKARIAGAVLV